MSHTDIGGVLRDQGKLDEALANFQAGRDILEKLTRLSPKHAGWKKDFERVTKTLSQEERK